MGKIALILNYKIFVTKKIFFLGMNIKKFFDPHVSCRPGRVTANQHIFKPSLMWNTQTNYVQKIFTA